MYLHEAVKKAMEQNRLIYRKSKPYSGFEPTNSPDCCILHDIINPNGKKGLRWQPQADDLTCDDWELYER
jgi:hypothetical protein